jgi:hypothetical protein
MLDVKVMKAFGYTICDSSLVIDMHGFTCKTCQISWLIEHSKVLIKSINCELDSQS